MTFTGSLTDEELIEFIELNLKLETIRNLVNSKEYSDAEKVNFIKAFIKEAKA